jgi:hypothetical protein
MNKKRGVLFYLIFWFQVIINVFQVYVYFFNDYLFNITLLNSPGKQVWQIRSLGVYALIYLVFLIGIWQWRKWGVYGFGIFTGILMLVDLFHGRYTIPIIYLILFYLIYRFVFKPIWKDFK